MTTFTFHADPSHGWLEVPVCELSNVGLSPRDFSGYSYMSFSGLQVYLEEDVDAPKFFRVYESKHGSNPVVAERYSSKPSFIRNLARVQPWRA